MAYQKNELFKSTLFSRGIYALEQTVSIQDPVRDVEMEGILEKGKSCIVRNVYSGERFYLKRFKGDAAVTELYRRKVLMPPAGDDVLWPSDMVVLQEEQQNTEVSSLFVSNIYSENPPSASQRFGNLALLFSAGSQDALISLPHRLKMIDPEKKNWQNAEIRRIACDVLAGIQRLNQAGYIYDDISLERIFFRNKPDGTGYRLYLNFSNLIFSFDDTQFHAEKVCMPQDQQYPLQFMEPAITAGIQKTFDFNTQNYSLTALLFWLFFNRACYDGKMMIGKNENDIWNSFEKYRLCQEHPYFIFDETDHRNEVTDIQDEDAAHLWEACPESVRMLFYTTLCEKNAMRQTKDIINPTPELWLKTIREANWNRKLETETCEDDAER